MQGISSAAVGGLMKYLAPLLMGIIARKLSERNTQQTQTQQTGNQTSSGSAGKSILDSILGKKSEQTTNQTNQTNQSGSMFDKDGDGSFLDDLLGGLFK